MTGDVFCGRGMPYAGGPERSSQEYIMFNMNNKKKNQRISVIIVILLVLAMVVPLVASMFY